MYTESFDSTTPKLLPITKRTALYIHFPWCQRKCPYCDFSSFESTFSEEKYIKTLIQDFKQERTSHQLISIFIGGGTPSLLSAHSIETLLTAIHQETSFDDGIEITLEFMLNALRFIDGFSIALFEERTGIKVSDIKKQLEKAQSQGFIEITNQIIRPTKLGQRYLNDCLEIFM